MYFKEDTEKSIFFSKKNSKTICSLKISCTFALVKQNNGAIAQLVEQRTENPCVPGSIPGGTTKKNNHLQRCRWFYFCPFRSGFTVV